MPIEYAWSKLPLILLYASGYLMYRMVVVTRVTDVLVMRLFRHSQGRFPRLLLQVTASAVLLSFFIPNAVTVLILLPILKTVDRDAAPRVSGDFQLTTPLALAAIYGANIGGMGSLIGSPANLLLMGALDLYGVPGREQVNFFSWFLWSLPLVFSLCIAAWWIVYRLGVPRHMRKTRIHLKAEMETINSEQKSAGKLFMLFLVFWILESFAGFRFIEFSHMEPLVCVVFFIGLIYVIFFRKPAKGKHPLLKFQQLFTGLPRHALL